MKAMKDDGGDAIERVEERRRAITRETHKSVHEEQNW